MADKVKRTPAKLSKLVEDFDMEIVCRGSDYDQRTVSISDMNRPALPSNAVSISSSGILSMLNGSSR